MIDACPVPIVLGTIMGSIEIEVYPCNAPASARAFLILLDDGGFAQHGTFYRTVRKHENDHGHPTIDVIQGGLQNPPDTLIGIEHETTLQTGLRHLDGTVSLARGAVGTATGAAFFICIGDQPALDAGGERYSDGQGFAAFGRVTQGMEIVRAIHRLQTTRYAKDDYQSGQILDVPVRFSSAARKSPAAGLR